jgi:hypothetical protein
MPHFNAKFITELTQKPVELVTSGAATPQPAVAALRITSGWERMAGKKNRALWRTCKPTLKKHCGKKMQNAVHHRFTFPFYFLELNKNFACQGG